MLMVERLGRIESLLEGILDVYRWEVSCTESRMLVAADIPIQKKLPALDTAGLESESEEEEEEDEDEDDEDMEDEEESE